MKILILLIAVLLVGIHPFGTGCASAPKPDPPDRECCREYYIYLCKQEISEKEKDREMKRHIIEKHYCWWEQNELNQNGR